MAITGGSATTGTQMTEGNRAAWWERVRRLVAQVFKFGIVGGIAFLIDYGLLVFLHQICGIHVIVSATISFTVSLVFNYFASMRYVFRGKEGVSRIRQFALFAVLSVIGLGLNDAIMWAGVAVSIDYRIVKLVASAIVMVYNFVTRKRLLEGRTPVADDDLPVSVAPPSSQPVGDVKETGT